MSDSTVVSRERCPKCAALGNDKSGNNLAVYTDGHAYCFAEGCGYYRRSDGKVVSDETKVAEAFTPTRVFFKELTDRRLTEKTLRLFGYGLSRGEDGNVVHCAPYYKDDVLVAQHVRFPNKDFTWRGEYAGIELFGQRLWRAGGKAPLIITEGEIDAMTVAQVLDYRVPVVSIPNGTRSAVKDIKNNLEFVTSFPEIILMFDMDAPGKKAAHSVAEILPPGRVRIAALPLKDANKCLQEGDTAAIITARYQAAIYSPDEICHASEIISRPVSDKPARVWCYPFDSLTERLIGRRSGEIVMWGSGTGSGKSTLIRELIHSDLIEGRKVGAIMLEESPEETIDDIISLMISKPVRKIKAFRIMNELRRSMNKSPIENEIVDTLTDEEYRSARDHLIHSGLYIYDHMGNNSMQNLMARMEYMSVALEVDTIVLDHITAAATGIMASNQFNDDGTGGERLVIDQMMKDLRNLCTRTSVHIDIISQLKKANKAFEEGDRITLQDFRGSGALISVPNVVIALERDRQSTDINTRMTTEVRLLKDRLTGRSGVVAALRYSEETGRLTDVPFTVDEEGKVQFDPEFEEVALV
jgi:twinkle protein